MSVRLPAAALALCIVSALGTAMAGEDPRSQVSRHVEAARAAAGTDHAFIFGQLCEGPIRAVNAAPVKEQVPVALAIRAAGAPNPYIIGNESVQRFLTAAEQCAIAARISEHSSFK